MWKCSYNLPECEFVELLFGTASFAHFAPWQQFAAVRSWADKSAVSIEREPELGKFEELQQNL